METAAAPVSLKGTREPLLLLGSGLLLSLAWTPITGMIGAAGIALGMHDLRKCESAKVLGRWGGICEIAAWCTCAFWISSFTPVNLLLLGVLTQTFALCGAAIVLERLARASGATRLVRVIWYLGWLPLVFPLVFTLGFTQRQWFLALMPFAFLVHPIACLSLAVLTLQVRTRALPYGKRLVRRAA